VHVNRVIIRGGPKRVLSLNRPVRRRVNSLSVTVQPFANSEQPLLELGAKAADSPQAVAEQSDMVFAIPDVLAYISTVMTLDPGDLVLTGSPAGVGKLSPGDEVEVEVLGFSRVRNAESGGAILLPDSEATKPGCTRA